LEERIKQTKNNIELEKRVRKEQQNLLNFSMQSNQSALLDVSSRVDDLQEKIAERDM
jgi:uncharacterized protein YydD (DUF2326 family)